MSFFCFARTPHTHTHTPKNTSPTYRYCSLKDHIETGKIKITDVKVDLDGYCVRGNNAVAMLNCFPQDSWLVVGGRYQVKRWMMVHTYERNQVSAKSFQITWKNH